MNPLVVIYFICGIFYVVLENNLLKKDLPDLSTMSRKDKVFCLLHQVTHYFRFVVLWPTYLFEEILIHLYNITDDDEEE